ncbi:hypothetical protein FDJ44_gp09 [Microbacterium phage Pikmin]|uniref:Uncharacterized protein n=3 Tax=Pikminvirus pikmin TaxID=2560596 RepID=A0A2P1CL41_9CAUD|nr:hypothetical protein FDJ44_gp09 [Microbacterium phage Pikmin]AVJ51000.1 hypothetical protein PBI_PAJAZA_9 [Microbacterium phage Pajaza]AVJ51147.1 hypothetical protein PBI_PIKMIN_9 [Microbacterium phage Pikmin]AVJ51705.1 hypothetical protein PBI_CASEY_9 [Microbacterium phage Casey]
MVMSTQTLAEASSLLDNAVLEDVINIYEVGDPVTVGIEVTRPLSPLAIGVAGLVQTTTLANAVESRTDNVYSIKVSRGTILEAGMVVEVDQCLQEPSLTGKKLLVDKVSQNGLAIIRKAVASDWTVVNQEGKEGL